MTIHIYLHSDKKQDLIIEKLDQLLKSLDDKVFVEKATADLKTSSDKLDETVKNNS